MQLKDIMKIIQNPKPYDKGTAQMWTDPHISEQLLHMHINENSDAASRKTKNIEKTVDWLTRSLQPGAKVLDLGCGPGLYAQRLAQAGFDVTGIDFSASSIAYAKAQAKEAGLAVRYICRDYLKAGIPAGFDAAILIYCDFGVLDPEQRTRLLSGVRAALRPGGLFVFDALNKKAPRALHFGPAWEISGGGFWLDAPYACLSEKLHFPGHKAILDQHIVLPESGENKLYRFWNHYFSEADVRQMAKGFSFSLAGSACLFEKGGGPFNDDGVTFYTLRRNGAQHG